ncbi:MAG: hypothetical protein WKF73_09630 [Nocardioidaceae bacterium]
MPADLSDRAVESWVVSTRRVPFVPALLRELPTRMGLRRLFATHRDQSRAVRTRKERTGDPQEWTEDTQIGRPCLSQSGHWSVREGCVVMPALSLMFGSIGSLLVLVSAVGGGITVARARVPRIDPTSRVLSGTAGTLLVALAMVAAMLALLLHSPQDPAARMWPTPVTDQPDQEGVDVGPGTDPSVVAIAALHRRQSFRMRSDGPSFWPTRCFHVT